MKKHIVVKTRTTVILFSWFLSVAAEENLGRRR
jgi:hypothetical protein